MVGQHRRRPGARARGDGPPGRCRRRTTSSATQTSSCRTISASAAFRSGAAATCRGPKARRKLKRQAIRDWVASGARPAAVSTGDDPVAALIARFAGGRAIDAGTSLDDLGLSSLERVELMVALEDRLQTRVDESQFAAARTIADVRALAGQGAGAGGGRRACQLSQLEPPSDCRGRPPSQSGDVDCAADARLRVDLGQRPRASRRR